jgi:hypothetical protein
VRDYFFSLPHATKGGMTTTTLAQTDGTVGWCITCVFSIVKMKHQWKLSSIDPKLRNPASYYIYVGFPSHSCNDEYQSMRTPLEHGYHEQAACTQRFPTSLASRKSMRDLECMLYHCYDVLPRLFRFECNTATTTWSKSNTATNTWLLFLLIHILNQTSKSGEIKNTPSRSIYNV